MMLSSMLFVVLRSMMMLLPILVSLSNLNFLIRSLWIVANRWTPSTVNSLGIEISREAIISKFLMGLVIILADSICVSIVSISTSLTKSILDERFWNFNSGASLGGPGVWLLLVLWGSWHILVLFASVIFADGARIIIIIILLFVLSQAWRVTTTSCHSPWIWFGSRFLRSLMRELLLIIILTDSIGITIILISLAILLCSLYVLYSLSHCHDLLFWLGSSPLVWVYLLSWYLAQES